MKTLLPFIIILTSFTVCLAQPTGKVTEEANRVKYFVSRSYTPQEVIVKDSTVYYYSENYGSGYFDSLVSFTLDQIGNPQVKRKYRKYNETDQILQETVLVDSPRHLSKNYIHTYDNRGLKSSFVEQWWHTGINDWTDKKRDIFSYNSDSLVIEEVLQNYTNNAWRNYTRYIYNFDSGKLASSAHYYYSSDSIWRIIYAITYEYNSFDSLETLIASFGLDTLLLEWGEKHHYTYNADQQLESISRLGWQDTYWKNISKYVYTYTSDGRIASYTYQDWNHFINQWEDFSGHDNYYIADGQLDYRDYRTYLNNSWVLTQRDTFYYEKYEPVPEIIISALVAFPNPFGDMINIHIPAEMVFDKIELFNLSGQRIYSENISGKPILEISTASFPNGVYFYKLSGESETKTGKLLKSN